MQIPTIPAQFTPLAVRRELRYTLVRLRNPTWAKPYVTTFEAMVKACESYLADEMKLRDAVEDAEAELDQADADLDERALYLAKFLKAEISSGARHRLSQALFGTDAPSRFVRPRLGEELERVRSWPTVLAGAPLAKLVALGPDIEALIKRCDAAVKAEATAAANLQSFVTNSWAPFVNKVNAERQSLGGEAKKQLRLDGSEGSLGLFRPFSRSRPKEEPTLALIDQQIQQTESDLAELHKQKTALQAAATAEAAAEAERAQKEAELAQLRKSQAEAAARAKAIEAELAKK